jgi:hypothetical protein
MRCSQHIILLKMTRCIMQKGGELLCTYRNCEAGMTRRNAIEDWKLPCTGHISEPGTYLIYTKIKAS